MAPLLLAACGSEPACPPLLASAERLIVVTAADIDSVAALIETFARVGADRAWQRVSGPEPAVVGKAGVGWAAGFAQYAAKGGEPVKQEGDKRAPAGVFPLGPTFGFEARDGAAHPHLTLEAGEHLCVDDPTSPHYGRVVARAVAGEGTRGEEMWKEPLYEKGLVVDYPPDAARRSGSCIFIHIWKGPDQGTSGCIALPVARVAALQEFAAPVTASESTPPAVIAILPKSARALARCLPGG